MCCRALAKNTALTCNRNFIPWANLSREHLMNEGRCLKSLFETTRKFVVLTKFRPIPHAPVAEAFVPIVADEPALTVYEDLHSI